MDASPQHTITCCYGDRLQGQQFRGSSFFYVCLVDSLCGDHVGLGVNWISWWADVSPCVCAHEYTSACNCLSTHLCCGWGYQCWNLRSRWRSTPQEDCSSPSRHMNTITIATRMRQVWVNLREWNHHTVCYLHVQMLLVHNFPFHP